MLVSEQASARRELERRKQTRHSLVWGAVFSKSLAVFSYTYIQEQDINGTRAFYYGQTPRLSSHLPSLLVMFFKDSRVAVPLSSDMFASPADEGTLSSC